MGFILKVPELFEDLLGCEKLTLDVLVVCCWMVFCPIVSIAEWAWPPVETEFRLGEAASEPVETHVHGFGPFWFQLFVDYPFGCVVVGLY